MYPRLELIRHNALSLKRLSNFHYLYKHLISMILSLNLTLLYHFTGILILANDVDCFLFVAMRMEDFVRARISLFSIYKFH